jgi:beta-glucanase (GH16 family)
LPAGSIYTDFHTYAVDWEPDSATFYVDNHMVMSRRFRWVLKDGSVAPPAYIILNMACGGVVPGWPNSAAEFPAAVEAQYIRVWQKPGEYPG